MACWKGGGRRNWELSLKLRLSGMVSGVAVMERGAARATIRSQNSVVFSFKCQVVMAEGRYATQELGKRPVDCKPKAP